jgi:hypothetical protein
MLNERDLIASYPRPIVEAYLRAQKTTLGRTISSREKVTALTTLGEVVTQYTAVLAIAQYGAYGLQDKDTESELRKFARDAAKVSFGVWLGLLQRIVRAFEQSGFADEAIVPRSFAHPTHKGDLLELYQTLQTFIGRFRGPKDQASKVYMVSCQQVLEMLIQLRNIVAHESTLDDADLIALDCAKSLTQLRALLGEMAFLAEYSLVYIDQIVVVNGKHVHEARTAMGTVFLPRPPFEFDRPLNTDNFYIFHPTRDEPLICLGPLLRQDNDDILIAPAAAQADLRRVDSRQRLSLFGLMVQADLDNYRGAVQDAVEGGKLSASHQRNLDRLAENLGIPTWLARQIEAEVKSSVSVSTAPAVTLAAPNVDWEITLDRPVRKIALSRLANKRLVWVVACGPDQTSDLLYLLDGDHAPRPLRGEKSRVETIACAERENICAVGYWNGQVLVFDGQGRPKRGPHNLGGVVRSVTLSADGTKLAAATWADRAYLFDLESGASVSEVALADAGRCIALNAAADQAAVGTYHGSVTLFGADEVKLAEELGELVVQVAFVEGNKLIAAHADGRVVTFDSAERRPCQVGGDRVSDLAVARDGRKVVVAYGGRRLTFLSDSGGQLRPAQASDIELDGEIVHLSLSDDGRWCFVATSAGSLYVFEESFISAQWALGKTPVDLVISADARHLALAFADGTVRFLTLSADIVPTVKPNLEVQSISAIKLSRDRRALIEMVVRNRGDGVAREVSAAISGPLKGDTRATLVRDLPPDASDKLKFSVSATEVGTLLLEFEISYSDYSNGRYTEVTYLDDDGAPGTGARFSRQFEAE